MGRSTGIPPPTLASNRKFALFCAAIFKSSAPFAATSSLFEVTTLFPFSISFLTKSKAEKVLVIKQKVSLDNYCHGCGMCANVCPNGAIKAVRNKDDKYYNGIISDWQDDEKWKVKENQLNKIDIHNYFTTKTESTETESSQTESTVSDDTEFVPVTETTEAVQATETTESEQ